MSGDYVPGSIGNVLAVDSKSDELFSAKPSQKLKAQPLKPQFEPAIAKKDSKHKKRDGDTAQDDSKRRKTDSKEEGEQREHRITKGDDDEDNDASEESSHENDERAARTAFIGNLPVRAATESEDATKPGHVLKKLEKALKKEFMKYGRIESIRLRSIGLKSVKVPTGSDYKLVRKVAVAKGSFDERVNTCNAYIVFESEESVREAVEKADAMEFLGNHIRVDAVKEDTKGKVFDRKKSVFVGNIAFETSDEECWKHFAGILGENAVKSVRVIRDPATNLARGFGYVLLRNEAAVEDAVAKVDGSSLRDRDLRVSKCMRSAAKKQAKIATKVKDAKAKNPNEYRGEEATTFEGKKTSRRKAITLAQTAANKKKKKVAV